MRRSTRQRPSRRQALRTLAAGAVATTASGAWAASICALSNEHAHAGSASRLAAAQDWKPRVLNARQNDQVVVLTERIIPETDTPGARAALVNRFIDDVLQKAQPDVRARFLRGLGWMDARSKTLFGRDLLHASDSELDELLTKVSAEGISGDVAGVDFFRALKSMTINGYYTTEIGLRRELGDPGQLVLPQFEGCSHPEHQ